MLHLPTTYPIHPTRRRQRSSARAGVGACHAAVQAQGDPGVRQDPLGERERRGLAREASADQLANVPGGIAQRTVAICAWIGVDPGGTGDVEVVEVGLDAHVDRVETSALSLLPEPTTTTP